MKKTKCLTGLVNVDKIKAIINKKKRNVNMLMDYLNKITDHVNSTLTEIYKSLRFDFCFRKYLLYDIQDQNDQFSKHSNCGFIDRPILYSNPFSSSSTTSKHNQPLNDLLNYVNENDQQQTTNSQLNSLIAENNSNPFQQNPLLNIKNEHFQPQLTTQSNSVQKELFQQLTQKQNSQIKQHIVISKPIIQSMSLNQKQKQQPNIQQLSQHQNYDQKPLQNQRIIVCKPIIPSMILQRNTLQQPNKLQQQLNPTQQQQPNSTQQQQPNSTQQQPNSTQQQLNSTLDIQNLPFGRFKENFELQNMTQFKDMINVFQKSKLKPNRRQKK
ncbi:hypothetical protein QTN25_005892 [Entamoeba marina]